MGSVQHPTSAARCHGDMCGCKSYQKKLCHCGTGCLPINSHPSRFSAQKNKARSLVPFTPSFMERKVVLRVASLTRSLSTPCLGNQAHRPLHVTLDSGLNAFLARKSTKTDFTLVRPELKSSPPAENTTCQPAQPHQSRKCSAESNRCSRSFQKWRQCASASTEISLTYPP